MQTKGPGETYPRSNVDACGFKSSKWSDVDPQYKPVFYEAPTLLVKIFPSIHMLDIPQGDWVDPPIGRFIAACRNRSADVRAARTSTTFCGTRWMTAERSKHTGIILLSDARQVFVRRVSFMGKYDVVNKLPRYAIQKDYALALKSSSNPVARTGISGRGLLERWGPNHMSDPIFVRCAIFVIFVVKSRISDGRTTGGTCRCCVMDSRCWRCWSTSTSRVENTRCRPILSTPTSICRTPFSKSSMRRCKRPRFADVLVVEGETSVQSKDDQQFFNAIVRDCIEIYRVWLKHCICRSHPHRATWTTYATRTMSRDLHKSSNLTAAGVD